MHHLIGTSELTAVGLVGQFAIRSLEGLFAAGILGSAVVVIITFVEDLTEVFSNHEQAPSKSAAVSSDSREHSFVT